MRMQRMAATTLFALISSAPCFGQTNASASANLEPEGKYAISQIMGQDQVSFHAVESIQGLRFENPQGGISALVDAMGVTVRAATVSLGLRLDSVGYGDGPLGLQQGFTLDQRPTGSRSGELTLSLQLDDGLIPSLDLNGTGVSFLDPSGTTLFTYSGLVAVDSAGRTLDARLEVAAGSLLIRVDDSAARYPVVVDPLIESKLSASDNAAGDLLGADIAISGDVGRCHSSRETPRIERRGR